MLKYVTLIFAGAIALVNLSSCEGMLNDAKEAAEVKQEKVNYKRIAVEDRYSIEVSEKMKPTDMLNDDASLQYFNIMDDKYLVIIDEPWEDIDFLFEFIEEYDESKTRLENYAKVQLESLEEEMTMFNNTNWEEMSVNGMNAVYKSFESEIDAYSGPIAYTLVFVEGESTVYMLMSWTLAEKKDAYRSEQMHIFKSLKEMEVEEEPEV